MTCPQCGLDDVRRSRRQGWLDSWRSWMGWYPYRCGECGERFYAVGRRPGGSPAPQYVDPLIIRPRDFEVAFRADAVKPVAQVMVRADTHAELNQILLTLGRAISSYGRGGSAKATDAAAATEKYSSRQA